MDYKKEYELAKDIAGIAGDFINKEITKKIESSIGHDLKLELDKRTEDLILSHIKNKSKYPILSEESGPSDEFLVNTAYWIVDPIDGSLNYLQDIPFACVSIALWINDSPILGVVLDFNRGEMISSLKGEGAFFNGSKLSIPQKVEINQAVLATGFPSYLLHDTSTLMSVIDKIKTYKKIRLFGSAALSITYVALGRVHAYYEDSIKLWDVAAGIAICDELGLDFYMKCKSEFLYEVELSNVII